jgi:primosomal protein N' (replication factor Y)
MSERITLFADVIIPVPIHQEFTYRIPVEMNDALKPGLRVVVPFGKSKLVTGIVTKIHENIPVHYQARYIEHLLDNEPIITPEQYTFWKWIAAYYLAPIGDVMNAALPANFKLASETKIVLHPDFDPKHTTLTERQDQIVEALEIKEVLDLKEISEILGIKTIQPIIKELIDKRVVLSIEELNNRFVPKTAIYVTLNEQYISEERVQEVLSNLDSKKIAEKQLEAFLSFLNESKYRNAQ